jgi:alpha-tubulin suppressor-like RCC1 family protein
MPAHARLDGENYVFPDAAKIRHIPSNGGPTDIVQLLTQNDQEIALIRLGGVYVTVGNAPQSQAGA